MLIHFGDVQLCYAKKIVTRVIFLSGAGNGAVIALKAGRNAIVLNTDINSARVALSELCSSSTQDTTGTENSEN